MRISSKNGDKLQETANIYWPFPRQLPAGELWTLLVFGLQLGYYWDMEWLTQEPLKPTALGSSS